MKKSWLLKKALIFNSLFFQTIFAASFPFHHGQSFQEKFQTTQNSNVKSSQAFKKDLQEKNNGIRQDGDRIHVFNDQLVYEDSFYPLSPSQENAKNAKNLKVSFIFRNNYLDIFLHLGSQFLQNT